MKKLLILLTIVAVAVCFIAAPASAAFVPSAKGQVYDINKDGVFNQKDVDRFELCYGHKKGDVGWRCWVAFRYKVGMPYMVGDIYGPNGSRDGKVDSYDRMRLNKYINWYKINGWWQ
jgi:hypothetical protein